MKNNIFSILFLLVLSLAACNSETAPKAEEPATTATDTAAVAEDAINIEVPKEVVIFMSEKGDLKLMGEPFKYEELEQKLTELFEGYRAMGSKTMPPLNIEIEGTVTMGVRQEMETQYNEIKEKFENLH